MGGALAKPIAAAPRRSAADGLCCAQPVLRTGVASPPSGRKDFPMDTVAAVAPAVTGTPRLLLRIEGACIFAIAIVLYWRLSESWWLFVVLFLVPDLSFLGYLAEAGVGAIAYNLAHTVA